MGLLNQETEQPVVDEQPAAPEQAVTPEQGAQTANTSDAEKAIEAIKAKVPQDQQDALRRVVLAGKKILYSKETNPLVDEAMAEYPDDPYKSAGEGIIKLIYLLSQESRGTIPQPVVMPAMLILLMDLMMYLADTGAIPAADNEAIGRASEEMLSTFLESSGLSPEMVQEILGKTQEAMQNPEGRAEIERARGGA